MNHRTYRQRGRALGARSFAWPTRRCVRVAALALSCSLTFGSAFAAPPSIANPDLFEKSLGAASQAAGQYGLLDDREQIDRVNRIGYRLGQRAGFDKYPFTFGVVDMSIPNAFALPAGQIFVTRGMLDLGLDDDMLAALLGHEIAHVTQEHFLKLRKRATLLTLLSQLATLGAVAAASSSRDDYYVGPGGLVYRDDDNSAALLQATQATGVVVSELLLRSYSRDNEDESDEEGQRLAALAGFDPDGARRLMLRMQAMIPQSKTFGYWQTHPFFDARVLAAEARGGALRREEAAPEAEIATYRQQTQSVLLDYAASRKSLTPPGITTLKHSALDAWPQGPAADGLRLERLHRIRDLELERLPLSRNYGRLIDRYREEMTTVGELTPESPLLRTLTNEVGEMRHTSEELYSQALEILEGGVYETSFLKSFVSNYPGSERSDEAALKLGLAYSRLGRETDAVEQFLRVWESSSAGDLAKQAGQGLRNLAPVLTQLGALEHLSTQQRDPELGEVAAERLDNFAAKFDDIANGAEYLVRFPEGRYVDTVTHRVHALADSLYREMLLYQQLGDSGRAIERANLILEHAPLSPAAERLGRQLDSEVASG